MLDLIRSWIRAPRREAARVDDSLDAFGSEQAQHVPPSTRFADALRSGRYAIPWRLAGLVAVVILMTGSLYQVRDRLPFMNVEAASASLTIESVPAGAEVLAGGVWQGRTPVTLAVPPGQHWFELVHEGRRKSLVAEARAGAAVVHHVEFDALPPPKKASLSITTEPAKLRVLVDGVARGVSPLTVGDIDAGTHEISVAGTSGTITRKVDVAAGESASMIISSVAPPASARSSSSGPAAGWLSISSPVVLQVLEGKDVIGTSASNKIMLPAGTHQLRLSNEALGFSERRVVHVRAGANASMQVKMPTAPLSINALPWAEVWLDGVRIGETPIGNRPVTLGSHELVFRHPELGERRQTVTVTLTSRARVSLDMTKGGQ